MTRRVVVIGGGYAGSLVAKELDPVAEVVLVDPREAFVNAAGSLRALTRPEWAPSVFFPFDTLLARGRVVRDRAVSVDPAGVTLASGDRIEADHLVLATGSGYPFPGKPLKATVAGALDDLREAYRELAGSAHALIVGGGPVGLELADEIKEVWPDKEVTVVGQGARLLPEYLPEVRAALHRQLDELGITVLLGAALTAAPPTAPGRAGAFTAVTAAGDKIDADIWFRAHGVELATGYLADGRLTTLTERGTVPVTERLTVPGHDHVYALGDIAELPEPKMATFAQVQAVFVAAHLTARLTGGQPAAAYVPTPHRRILLPLGSRHGVGQLPAPGGAAPAATEVVVARKGVDLFTARFAERFNLPH